MKTKLENTNYEWGICELPCTIEMFAKLKPGDRVLLDQEATRKNMIPSSMYMENDNGMEVKVLSEARPRKGEYPPSILLSTGDPHGATFINRSKIKGWWWSRSSIKTITYISKSKLK